jgi:hypothetical protein
MAKILPKTVEVIGRADGQRATLISTGLLRCECLDCIKDSKRDSNGEPTTGVFYANSDQVAFCPTCGRQSIKKTWTRPMTVLVPETEMESFMDSKPEP